MASRVQTWKADDASQPKFPEDFEILKKAVLQVTDIKTNRNKYYAVELHHAKSQKKGPSYRVFTHYGRTDDLENNPESGQKECRYLDSEGEANGVYDQIYKEKTSARKGYREVALASSKIGSQKARGSSSGDIDEKTLKRIESVEEPVVETPKEYPAISDGVRSLVRYLYDEAVGALTSRVQAKVTAQGIETPLGVLTIGQIEQGETILGDIYKLLQKKQTKKAGDRLRELSSDFYTVIPHRFGRSRTDAEAAIIRDLNNFQIKQETLQLMKDMLQVNGDGGLLHAAREEEEYAALGCEIDILGAKSSEFKKIKKFVVESQVDTDDIEVLNVYKISRPAEEARYLGDLGNEQLLFHGSRIQNWVGILSRGLLMPKVVVKIGVERTDEGWLGNGIYFGNASCTSSGYTSSGKKGTSLMALAKVSLGKVKQYKKITYGLTAPPKGFHSCHGIRDTEFEDDEFVVYDEAQQKLAYLVEFSGGRDWY
ncbi:MAG: WGR domain-containing protein [Myxococcales bacterium]|nr:WGR domain-containing protein [Myxococcales bacterium]